MVNSKYMKEIKVSKKNYIYGGTCGMDRLNLSPTPDDSPLLGRERRSSNDKTI